MGSIAVQHVRRLLESRAIVVWSVLFGVLLTFPALFSGFQTEDWVFRASAKSDLFSLPWRVNLWGPDGRPDDDVVRTVVYESKRLGTLPWFSDESFHVSLWRPLASFTHHLEFRLYPDSPLLMHAQNLLFYGLLIASAGGLYRCLLAGPAFPRWAPGLAVLAYAIDDAHGHPVGWIMNRAAVMAALFGVLSIWFFERWRRHGYRAGATLCAASLALGLLSSEFALGAVGYLGAHSLLLDPARPLRRLAAALFWVIPVLIWAIAYKLLGHGSWNSALYIDPLAQPLTFLESTFERGSVLLLAQIGFPPSDLFVQWTGLYALLVVVAAALVVLGTTLIVWPLLRKNRVAAFFGLGTLLSVVPASAAFPQDRMLLLTGVGAMGLLSSVAGSLGGFGFRSPLRRRAVPVLVAAFAVAHLVVAPALLPLRALTMWRYDRALTRARESAFRLLDHPHQELVLLNAPDAFFGTMLVMTRTARKEPLPPLTLCLTGSLSRLELRRTDPYTIELLPEKGFVTPGLNQIYRSALRPMQAGTVLWFPSFQIRVDRVSAAGEPLSARFRFSWPLESPRMVFAAFREGRYERIAVPPVGGTLSIEPPRAHR